MTDTKNTILFLVTQSELGGAQKYIADLAYNVRDQYRVIVAFGEQGEEGELAHILKQMDVKYFVIKNLKRKISPKNDLIAFFQLIKLFKNTNPDIIHLNSSKISILGSIASFFTKAKIIYTAHGWVFNEPLSDGNKRFYLWAEKFTSIFKDRIICVSEYDRAIAIKQNITKSNKLITIHNGLQPIEYLSKENAKQILWSYVTNLDIVSGQHIIGSVGNLYKTKGYEYLLKAMSVLRAEQIDANLIIVGEGIEKRRLYNLVKKLNLEDRVSFPGRIPGAAKLLRAFDIYVCSSLKEGLSYTIIEALFAGLPIIATNVGGNPELILDKKTGLLVKPSSPEDITKKIITILTNDNIRHEIGAQAKEYASKNFTLDTMIQNTIKQYY